MIRHNVRHHFVATLLTFAVGLMLLQLVACGASQRQTALKTAIVGVDAAAAAFITWDEQYQDKIVDEATDKQTGAAQLALYRANRERVYAAFVVAYRAIATASTDDKVSLASAVANVQALYDAIIALRAAPPPPRAPAKPAAAMSSMARAMSA